MDTIAIKFDHVSKEYRLGAIGGGTLKGDLQSLCARICKKEDPNRKIGMNADVKIGERFLALDDISFEIKKGETVGIIGHNGAGKSTLLKLLCRVTAPTKGTIGYNGRIASMLEVGTGFHPEMTGRENIYLNGAILGMTKAEIDSKIEQIIDFSEVRKFIDTPVKRYSSGMFVKLAFSVAAHLDSEIMIMDEVLAVGDMAFQKKCLAKMREAAQIEGRTVLYVSHNMNTIRTLCDRCIVLDKGKVIFDGDVEEAISIYMGLGNTDDFPVKYDFTNNKRRKSFGKQIFVTNFAFYNKNVAEFNENGIAEFEIKLNSKIDIEDIRCIIRVKDYDNVLKIAGCLSEPFDVSKCNGQIVRLSFNLKGIVHGDYCLSFAIIKQDQAGNYYYYDNPDAIIPIKIVNMSVTDINWSKRYWGNMRLDPAKIISNSFDY